MGLDHGLRSADLEVETLTELLLLKVSEKAAQGDSGSTCRLQVQVGWLEASGFVCELLCPGLVAK